MNFKTLIAYSTFAGLAITSGNSLADNVEDIRYRVQKVGKLNIGEVSAAPAAAADTSTDTASANPADLYQSSCFACHGTGAAGAPITGDQAAWVERISQGEDALLDHAINGINAMPPRGGTSLDDAQLKQIVTYMIEKSQ